MRMPIACCLLGILALMLGGTSKGASSKTRQQPGDTGAAVACRAMEVHTDDPMVTEPVPDWDQTSVPVG